MPSPTTDSSGPSTSATSGDAAPSQTDGADLGDNSSGGGGLSVGAKAGIGVGVSVGAIAVFAVLALLFLRRRRKDDENKSKAELESSGDGSVAPGPFGAPGTPGSLAAPSELESRGARPWSMRSELDGTASTVTPVAAKRESNLRHSDSATLDPQPYAAAEPRNGPIAELPG